MYTGMKPFAEVEGDTRVHDEQFDRNGYERDSSGGYAKAGTSLEFTRLLIGEISIGYAARNYVDPRLSRLEGFLVTSSLVWSATPLTTAKFYSDTQIAETTLPGSPGVLVHTYTFEVDHDFRRWLTAIGKFTYGTLDYQGADRNDTTYSIEGDVIYKMTRNLWIKGTLRQDRLDSNVVNASSKATVVMLGVRGGACAQSRRRCRALPRPSTSSLFRRPRLTAAGPSGPSNTGRSTAHT